MQMVDKPLLMEAIQKNLIEWPIGTVCAPFIEIADRDANIIIALSPTMGRYN